MATEGSCGLGGMSGGVESPVIEQGPGFGQEIHSFSLKGRYLSYVFSNSVLPNIIDVTYALVHVSGPHLIVGLPSAQTLYHCPLQFPPSHSTFSSGHWPTDLLPHFDS